jgi:hypothetical protein
MGILNKNIIYVYFDTIKKSDDIKFRKKWNNFTILCVNRKKYFEFRP